jgi:hypothetical protein
VTPRTQQLLYCTVLEYGVHVGKNSAVDVQMRELRRITSAVTLSYNIAEREAA